MANGRAYGNGTSGSSHLREHSGLRGCGVSLGRNWGSMVCRRGSVRCSRGVSTPGLGWCRSSTGSGSRARRTGLTLYDTL